MLDILFIFINIFGHCLLCTSIIFGGNTLPQKRLNASSPPPVKTPTSGGTTTEEKLKTCEESKTITKTEDEVLSEKTCAEDFVDDADKPTVFEKVNCVIRPAVDNPKRAASKSKNSNKKLSEAGDGKRKKRKSRNKIPEVKSAENLEAAAGSEEKKNKKKKKKKSKDGTTKKVVEEKNSKEKMDVTDGKESKATAMAGSSDAKLKVMKGKE